MEIEQLKDIIRFTAQEKKLIEDLDILPDLFLPLLLSIRGGGDWSYAAEDVKSVSVLVKTTRYDRSEKKGYTLENIYLLIDPVILGSEGNVARLEKCGKVEERLLVMRPYSVSIKAQRIIMASIFPLKKEIVISELTDKELSFEGSDAYDFMHEYEHLTDVQISGEPLWGFTYILK